MPARIELVPFTADHLPAVKRFSETTWNRPRGEAFYRWRYLEAPAQTIQLALRGGEIVAMICAFRRDYRFGGERRTCLETFDWYCLPEFRGSGIGVRVMQALMRGGEPIVAIGGTTDTLTLLPRLGWRRLTEVTCHRLPLDGSVVTDSLRSRFGIPPWAGRAAFDWIGRPWFAPRARHRPGGGEVRPGLPDEGAMAALYEGDTGYRVLPLSDPAHLRWLTGGFPEAGPYVPLHFALGGRIRGWTLLRVHGPEAARVVTLVEAYAPHPDESLYVWMVSESLLRTAHFRPVAVDTQTACPILRSALRTCRFLGMGTVPVHVWPGDLPGALDPVHLVCNSSDGAIFPYPEDRPRVAR